MSSITHHKKVFILALSGIGNFLMQLPTIKTLKKAQPSWEITVWLAPRGTRPLAEATPEINYIIEGAIKRSLVGHLYFTYQLARKKPDIALMLSSGQLWKGAAYMFLSGADQRIAHRYPHLGNAASNFLLTHSIPEDKKTHDIDKNLRLLSLLDIPIDDALGQPYSFSPPQNARTQAEHILRELHISSDKKIIGLHAGSAENFLWKRWPVENFAHVARALIANYQAHILIFGGPDEKKQKRQLLKLIGAAHASIVSADIVTTAAIIQHCQLFLANDSGLMHLAAAGGVPTFGLFGPTNETETGPRGSKSHVIRAPGTKPAYHTEHNYQLGPTTHESLLKITPDLVLATLKNYLAS